MANSFDVFIPAPDHLSMTKIPMLRIVNQRHRAMVVFFFFPFHPRRFNAVTFTTNPSRDQIFKYPCNMFWMVWINQKVTIVSTRMPTLNLFFPSLCPNGVYMTFYDINLSFKFISIYTSLSQSLCLSSKIYFHKFAKRISHSTHRFRDPGSILHFKFCKV